MPCSYVDQYAQLFIACGTSAKGCLNDVSRANLILGP